MNKQTTKNFVLALLVSLVFLSACNAVVETPTPITETQTPTVWSTPTRTTTPTFTPNPTRPRKPTKTITPTIEPILNEKMDSWLREMFAKPNCDLPCIWGITPGQTTINQANAFLYPQANYVVGDNQVTNSSNWAEIFYYETYQTEERVIMAVSYLEAPTEEINLIGIEEYPAYNLGNVLAKYGVPGEIWIDVYSENLGQSSLGFSTSLMVYYPNRRSILYFHDSDSTFSDGYITSCFSNSTSVRSWSRGFDQEFMELFYWRTIDNPDSTYKTFTDTSQMDLIYFHAEALTSTGEICITTPLDIWYQFEEVERDGERND